MNLHQQVCEFWMNCMACGKLHRRMPLTPPTIEIVGFLGGSCKAHHHAACQVASYAVSHKKPRVWLSMSIQPLQVDQHTCLRSRLFECILRREFHLLRGSSLTRNVSNFPKNYYFRTLRLQEGSFYPSASALLYFRASLRMQEKLS